MKKKLTIALVISSVVIALGFFLYFIIESEISVYSGAHRTPNLENNGHPFWFLADSDSGNNMVFRSGW